MSLLSTATMLLHYKSWANNITFDSLSEFPESELYKERQSYFTSIMATLGHIYVVDDIFKAHLTSETHHYASRHLEQSLTLDQLYTLQKNIDQWYISYIENLTEEAVSSIISFEYIGGEKSSMSVFEIILHLVNHATNHRGHVNEMMCQTTTDLPAHDLSVYLRDMQKASV